MKEENDILQMLRDREDEFHLPLRPGGWEKLEAELAPEGDTMPQPVMQPKAHSHRLVWRMVAAVALLCLLISVSLLKKKEPASVVAEKQQIPTVSPVQQAATPEQALPQTGQAPQLHKPAVASIELMPELTLSDTVLPELQPVKPEVLVHNSHKNIGPQPDQRYKLPSRFHEAYTIPYRTRWQFGVQGGSNALSGMQGGYSYIDQEMSNPGPRPEQPDVDPDKPEEEDPEKGLQTKAAVGGGGSSSGNSDTYYYYRHRLPVTAGLSLQYRLSPRFAVETGLSYTYLYSDILEERKDKVGSQKLHYLGIPLKLSWTFYRQQRFSLYASGGGMIEYCISASNTQQALHLQRWQPSLNASLGMQLVLQKPVSLFVEPGVSYYYNLNPNRRYEMIRFETIRTAHPFTFNLQLGVRFTY